MSDEDDQFALFDEAGNLPHARNSDPATSHAAAAQVTTLRGHCAALLDVYSMHEHTGLTAEEAGERAGLEPWAASKRVSDLLRLGLVEPLRDDQGAKVTRKTHRANRAAQVLAITTAGSNALVVHR